MAFVPGMPTNLPDEAKEKAQASYDKQQAEKSNSSSSSSDYDTTKTTVPGMPSDIPASVQQAAQTSYNTQQAQKSSEPDPYSGDSASSNAPKYNQGIVGSEQKSSSTTTSTDTTGTNNAPKYNQGVTSAQIFIQNLPSEASFLETTFGQDAAKIIDGTNTAEFINELRDNSKAGTGTFKRFAENTKKGYATNANPTSSIPTSVQAKLLDNASKKAYRDTSATEKELIKAHNAIVTANTTFEDMLNEQKYNRNPYEIQCATSIDYTRMQREGYRTVYVEDGGGWLQSKDGIYTIGKNNLIGIPENTRTVMVDKDNNWYFIKDTDTEKKNRDFVDAAEVERTTKCNEILDKYNKYAETYELYAAKAKEAQDKSVLLNSLTEQAFIKANKTRSAEDIAVAQDYVEQLKNVNEQYNAAKEHMDSIQPHLTGFINQYAQTANKYDTAISNTKGWSVEDELAYQELAKKIAFTSQNTLSAMAGKNGMPSDVAAKLTGTIASRASSQYLAEIAAYNDMTKRREANGNTPAYISNDAMKKMQETADNMQKLVERYNKWDNALIHTENGEGFGTALRRILVSKAEEYGKNLLSAIIAPYIKDNQKEKIKETITTLQDSQKKALKNMDEALIKGNPFINAIQYVGHKVYEKITGKDAGSQEILNKNTLYLTATEMQKASEALKNGDINYNDYIQFERYITNHTKSVMFNNVISNLDVFDLTSIQREFVAWRMGAHPELYSDDPKFKRMQDAYKKIYGTDYAGKQDQLRMAYVALHTETNLDDYVYLDGSDLRHEHLWKGEQYGTLASLAVGMFTDLANLGGLASKGLGEIGAAIAQDSKTSVINTLKDAASDALEDMIMRNSDNIAQDTVTAFVRSDEIQSKISKAVNAAVHDVYTKGDDITEAIAKRESNLFNDIINKPTSELVEHLNAADKADFAIESKNIVAKMSDDVLDQALKLQKNTVIVSTLRDTANAIEDLQSVLFKATCPVAGAVVGISKAYKGAQYIINNHLNKKLSRDATDYIVSTSKQAYAVASKAQIDFVTDKGKLKAYMDSINMAFAECAEGAKKNIKPIVNEIFEPFSKNVLRTSANQYVSKVVDHYTDIFNKGGLKSLERAAGAHGFVSFKQMYSNIKDNIGSVMREYSDDVDAILSTLDAKYARAAAQETINDISNIQHVATIHTNAVQNFINNGIPSCLPSTNPVRAFITVLDENATVIQNPTLLQGASINMANSIYNFTRTANPEWMKFTNAAGEVDSIVVAAQDAIDVLDELATGSFGIHELTHAQEVVQTYLDQVENIYMKNLDNAKADALIDGIGYTNYADKIESLVVGQPPLNDTVLRTVSKNLQERITNMGYTVSVEDIINKVFVDPHALEKLDPIHRDTIYRVMWDKGSTCIAQINDKNFIEFASKIADSNSPENKALVMYADALETLAKTTTTTDVSINAEELLEKSSRIKTAIQNASAVSCTKELDNVLAKSGIDSVTHTSIIDSWVGLSNHGINYIAASYPVDQAIDRISKMLCNDVQAQLAKHEGRFPRLTHLGATSVNVETNALTIERIINNNPELAAKLNEGADEYTDICFSILRTSDSGAPKDIALHVRGSKDKALVLRIKAPFDTTDDFAGKTFSCNAESARAQYKALGNVDTISREEFQKQLKDFITQQKDIALDKNKTLRFIGFNSSDALTGDNRFMNRTIRSCGVSINTANSIDLADIIRSNMGEYVLSSDVVADIRTGVSNAVRRSKANAITLDISPNISYDTAYTCRELLGNALKDVPTQLKQFSPVLDDISTSINKIGSNIDNIAYTTFGNHALGMLVDTKALSDLLVAAGAAPTRVYQDIMASMRNVLGTDNVNQLTLHKVIDTKFVSYYFDTDKLSRKIGDIADHLDYIHTQTQRINRIYNDIVRTDLIDALNPKKLGDIYHCMLATARTNNRLGQLVRSLKFDSLTTAEKYAVTSWLYDNIVGMLDEDQLINLHTIMLHKGAAGAYVLPEGRQFITNTLLDYTDAVMDKFAVKYLDESEAGQQFAIAFNSMQANNSMIHGMKEYDETINALS